MSHTPNDIDSPEQEKDGGFYIHNRSVCKGRFCPFHNPSNHLLKDAKIHIRADKMMLVERICEHGIGHDDPDSVAYFHSKGELWAGIHGCDGCCYDNKQLAKDNGTPSRAKEQPVVRKPEGKPSESSIDAILTDTAESICGEWCGDSHTGIEAVNEHMSTEKAALEHLIKQETDKARLDELKKVASHNNSEYTSDYIEERIASLESTKPKGMK